VWKAKGALISAAVLAGAFAAQPASSQPVARTYYMTGNRLWSACGETTEGPVPEACVAYVIGVADTVHFMATVKEEMLFCNGAEVTPSQLADVVRRYLAEHPAYRDKEGAGIVTFALGGAFPCYPPTL
jgi:hypothetical protein